jgi:hypothetical protein
MFISLEYRPLVQHVLHASFHVGTRAQVNVRGCERTVAHRATLRQLLPTDLTAGSPKSDRPTTRDVAPMPVRNANCLDDPPRCLPPVVAYPIAALQGLLHDIYKPKPAGAAPAQGTRQLEVPARTLLTVRVVPAQFCEFLTSRLHGNDDGASMTVSRQSVSAAMPLRPPVRPSSQRMQARVRVHRALQYMPAHARIPPAWVGEGLARGSGGGAR